MKKTLLFIITTICIISCNVNNNQKLEPVVKDVDLSNSVGETDEQVNPLTAICAEYLKSNTDALNNNVTRDKAAQELQNIIIDSISKNLSILQSVPFEYFISLPKGNKYLIKFTVSDFNDRNISAVIDGVKYVFGFELFAVVDEKIMSSLKDNKFYRIKSCKFHGSVNNKVALPDGSTFYQNSSFFLDKAYPNQIRYTMGGLYVTDLELEEF